MFILFTPIQNVWKVIASAIRQGKEMKDFSIEGKKNKKKNCSYSYVTYLSLYKIPKHLQNDS